MDNHGDLVFENAQRPGHGFVKNLFDVTDSVKWLPEPRVPNWSRPVQGMV